MRYGHVTFFPQQYLLYGYRHILEQQPTYAHAYCVHVHNSPLTAAQDCKLLAAAEVHEY